MKTPLYKQYANTPAIGVKCESNFGGLVVLDVLPGIDDYVVACYDWGTGRQMIRRHKICYTESGRAYFRKQDRRYYMDEIERV